MHAATVRKNAHRKRPAYRLFELAERDLTCLHVEAPRLVERCFRRRCAGPDRRRHGIGGERKGFVLRHACVPPTVIEAILTVGMPTPTGTCCPPFPHV